MTAMIDILILSASLVIVEFLLVLRIFEGEMVEESDKDWEKWKIPYRALLFRKISLFVLTIISIALAKANLEFILQNKQYLIIVLLLIISYFTVVYQEAIRAAKAYTDR